MWRLGGTEHHAQDWLRIKGGASKKSEEQMEMDQRGVKLAGKTDQLCRSDGSSGTWGMGYRKQEQKNSGTDNTRKEQFSLLFLFVFWVFF